MAYGPNDALYFGITAGELRRVSRDQLRSTDLSLSDTEQVATLPGAIGVETAPSGAAYVAVASQDENAGVWSVATDGTTEQLVSISGFPNDILFDTDRDRMLVTESQGGVVYSVTTDGTRSTWLDDDRLSTESFGANGLTRTEDGTVYVAVTQAAGDVGRLLEVPVTSSGAAGEPSVFYEGAALLGADGITARDSDIYVAANSQNRVVRVSPDGGTTTIADGENGLVFPSDVTFGTGQQSETLFICNFANQSPEDGAILRTEL
ncbi:SMP-30/gluconolactonase/LRE family protein [Halomicroarcula sp. GCM10025710]